MSKDKFRRFVKNYFNKADAWKSIRYCVFCGSHTLWERDKAIGHSRCVECGRGLSGKAFVQEMKTKGGEGEIKHIKPNIKGGNEE